jgi:hypothetical protein
VFVLEILYLLLVLFGGLLCFKGTEVPAFAGLFVDFSGINAVFAGFELPYHTTNIGNRNASGNEMVIT